MQGIKYVHCDYCMYGLPYRKSTTLWHSDSISLKLKTCTCKGAHKVKLGGNYNGYKRWSKKHLKGRIPEALTRSIAEQVMTQWGMPFRKSLLKRPQLLSSSQQRQTHGVLLGKAFVVATPDSGSTRSVITTGTADLVIKTNGQDHPGLKLVRVKPYQIDLADGKVTTCTHRAYADVTLVTPGNRMLLQNVQLNVLPGPPSSFLIGRAELDRLRLPCLWTLIGRAVQRTKIAAKPIKENAFGARDPLQEWRDRRTKYAQGEADSLAGLDDFLGHGAPEPTPNELRASVEKIVSRAQTDGAPADFVIKLRKLVLEKHYDVWRLMLGADAPARLIPMQIELDEGKFPTNLQVRRYGKEQQAFISKVIPRLVRAGILVASTSPFAVCVHCPFKPDGSLRLCADSRPANKVTVPMKFGVPNMSAMVQSLNGSKFFMTLDAVEGFFQLPLDPASYKYASIMLKEGIFRLQEP